MPDTCKEIENLYEPNRGLTINEFVDKKMANLNRLDLIKEYELIKKYDVLKPCEAFIKNQNKSRYRDIICLDYNRVILNNRDNITETDFVHANYVDGYKHKKAFICTQGPLSTTCADFWQMVWDEQSFVVVSLTKCTEKGLEKCSLYWPVIEWKALLFKHIIVHSRQMEHRSDYDVILLRVKNTKTGQVRFVYHLLYLQWPDYGTPESSLSFQRFLDQINYLQGFAVKKQGWSGCQDGPPVTIHCSAGVGRTGTLISLDICRRKLLDTGKIDVEQVVKTVRQQRAHSVQRPEQYVFLNLAIIEFAVHYMNALNISLNLVNFIEPNEKSKQQIQQKVVVKKEKKKEESQPILQDKTKAVVAEVFKENERDLKRSPELYPTVTPPQQIVKPDKEKQVIAETFKIQEKDLNRTPELYPTVTPPKLQSGRKKPKESRRMKKTKT